MTNVYFTSDTHFGHENMIKYEDRPYKNVTVMTEKLVANWNSRVRPNDLVYFLGDFCFRNTKGGKQGEGELDNYEYYKSMLNGDIVFVLGNHDLNNGVKTKTTAVILEAGGLKIYCCHDPLNANLAFPLNLCGHVHSKWKVKDAKQHNYKSTIINVGTDLWNYYPVSLTEVLALYNEHSPKSL